MLGATRMKWAIFAAVALSLACSSAYQSKTTMDELIELVKLLKVSPTDNSIKNKMIQLLNEVPRFSNYTDFVIWFCNHCSIDSNSILN